MFCRLRMSILEACIEKHLVPSLEVETRRELIRIGKEAILEEVSTPLCFSSSLRFSFFYFISPFFFHWKLLLHASLPQYLLQTASRFFLTLSLLPNLLPSILSYPYSSHIQLPLNNNHSMYDWPSIHQAGDNFTEMLAVGPYRAPSENSHTAIKVQDPHLTTQHTTYNMQHTA